MALTDEVKHKMNYIDWRGAKHIRLTNAEWNDFRKSLKDEDRVAVEEQRKTVKIFWFPGSWNIDLSDNEKYANIYFCDENYNFIVYFSCMDEDKNECVYTGSRSDREFHKMFKDRYGISMETAFGKCVKDKHELFNNCASTGGVWWTYDEDRATVLKGIYKADLKSAYPSCARGTMPNARKAISFKDDVVEPNEAYPFAFYDNGDIAIYGEVDTREMHNHEILRYPNSKGKFRWTEEPKSTVLMPAADYSLDDIVNEIYRLKELNTGTKRQGYKDILNKTFGFWYSIEKEVKNSGHYMPHLTAIIHARYLKRICGIYDKLVEELNQPLQILTDAIIWSGYPSETATHNKELGDFCYEVEGSRGVVFASGQYAYETKDGIHFAHQGIKGSSVPQNLTDLKEVIKFMQSDKAKKRTAFNRETLLFETEDI